MCFKSIEDKHDAYRGKDCKRKFCKSLRDHTMKIINLKLITKKQQESYENTKICFIFKEKFENKYLKDTKIS